MPGRVAVKLPGVLYVSLDMMTLKPEQLTVERFVQRSDVFAILPTGYEKSLCYGCLPLVYDN